MAAYTLQPFKIQGGVSVWQADYLVASPATELGEKS